MFQVKRELHLFQCFGINLLEDVPYTIFDIMGSISSVFLLKYLIF